MKVVVIGAGASGLMCAGIAAKNGNDVLLIDKNEKVGKKLYITGKGRCNLTNLIPAKDFFDNVVNNPKFLYSCINNFSSSDANLFFNNLGLDTKVERGNRVFPISDKSNDVINALKSFCVKYKVAIHLNENIVAVLKPTEKFVVKTNRDEYFCDAVVVATGGKSYCLTGSTGDGYTIAKTFGHKIIEPKPALVPIVLNDNYISEWEGVSLKNVSIIANIDGKSKSYFGEMLFTNNGISGPICLSLSSYINRANKVELTIDFKPAMTYEQLKLRYERNYEDLKNKQIITVLYDYLPKRLVDRFLNYCNIQPTTKLYQLNTKQVENLLLAMKKYKLNYNKLDNIEKAIITSGGVDVSQINPKTMESKICKNLYFIGEVLDVDALTGGFNLQIAWSTAYACANALK